ncbi:unnamed protein product [Heligmosomoides polygyrus]|uniref:Transp_Tc5_C domain-containing protein n=1 Tax=Heligmosomoides polygyrus TaxID=6339 RepID=A0A183FQY0_HELPZ|nr:unnamed protein product [Heligmosomoides polygyrus]
MTVGVVRNVEDHVIEHPVREGGNRDHENLVSEVPAGKQLKLMTIPPFNCFSRGNTLKVVSQTYRQFCAPVFRRCFAYAWVAAGYVDTDSGHFSTLVDYAFDEVPFDTPCQEASGCSSLAFIRCCWCQKL